MNFERDKQDYRRYRHSNTKTTERAGFNDSREFKMVRILERQMNDKDKKVMQYED
jgi:hypothetical protein